MAKIRPQGAFLRRHFTILNAKYVYCFIIFLLDNILLYTLILTDARGTAQTPPPMFHNAPLRNSNTSLQNNQPRARPVDQRQQNADTSWTYRSLPRTMRY